MFYLVSFLSLIMLFKIYVYTELKLSKRFYRLIFHGMHDRCIWSILWRKSLLMDEIFDLFSLRLI